MRCKPDEEQRWRRLDRFVSGRNNGLAVSIFLAAISRAQTRLVVTLVLTPSSCAESLPMNASDYSGATLPETVAVDGLWNANIHYHPLILEAIPEGAKRVLDVGCGDGILSAQVAQAGIADVVGLDLDAGVLERARARHSDANVKWIHGDVFSAPFDRGSFDAVVSVATLHHMDAKAALSRFAELVAPRGVVAVVGLAACDWWDLPYEAFAQGARTALRFVRGHWEHSAPMAWPPPATYGEMKRVSSSILPGVRYSRLLLGRYSLIWRKPS